VRAARVAPRLGRVTEHDFLSANAALGATDELDVDAMQLLFKVECSGEDFYNQLADRVASSEAAELLRRNGREELGHARRIQRALAIKTGEPFEPTGDLLERFSIPLPREVGPDLFPIIIEAEVQGDAGYQKWADRESDPEVARLLRLNGREETIHAERARQALALLQAAAPS
jgi:rubrerythrin